MRETKKNHESITDDETRLADMSLLEERSLLSRWFGSGTAGPGRPDGGRKPLPVTERPATLLEGKERRTAIRGALAASLLIGLVYVAAAGLLILFLLWIWGAL